MRNSKVVVNKQVIKKVAVATTLRTDPREIPQMPCPKIKPLT